MLYIRHKSHYDKIIIILSLSLALKLSYKKLNSEEKMDVLRTKCSDKLVAQKMLISPENQIKKKKMSSD